MTDPAIILMQKGHVVWCSICGNHPLEEWKGAYRCTNPDGCNYNRGRE